MSYERRLLSMLLANLDRLKAELTFSGVWDERKSTFFYLNRNMKWVREALTQEPAA